MPEFDEIQKYAQAAAEQAAIEIVPWYPAKIGDRFAGLVEYNGAIETEYGVYPTTTYTPLGDFIFDGNTIQLKAMIGKYIRVGWMGAVLLGEHKRLIPTKGDINAFHYQKDQKSNRRPSSEDNPYALVNVVAMNPDGTPKNPVLLPTTVGNLGEEIRQASPGIDPLAPREGEDQF